MEKYSKHLETIVAERTQDLLQEKQKTDRLLYSMEVYMKLQYGKSAYDWLNLIIHNHKNKK